MSIKILKSTSQKSQTFSPKIKEEGSLVAWLGIMLGSRRLGGSGGGGGGGLLVVIVVGREKGVS